MPSLQLDLTVEMGPDAITALAEAMSAAYSSIMGSDPRLMTVVVRPLPPGSIWTGRDPGARAHALLMCDVRAGRGRATRLELARRLVALVAEHTGVHTRAVKVELTQHAGDEMFHPHLDGSDRDGFNRDWDDSEASPDRLGPDGPG